LRVLGPIIPASRTTCADLGSTNRVANPALRRMCDSHGNTASKPVAGQAIAGWRIRGAGPRWGELAAGAAKRWPGRPPGAARASPPPTGPGSAGRRPAGRRAGRGSSDGLGGWTRGACGRPGPVERDLAEGRERATLELAGGFAAGGLVARTPETQAGHDTWRAGMRRGREERHGTFGRGGRAHCRSAGGRSMMPAPLAGRMEARGKNATEAVLRGCENDGY